MTSSEKAKMIEALEALKRTIISFNSMCLQYTGNNITVKQLEDANSVREGLMMVLKHEKL